MYADFIRELKKELGTEKFIDVLGPSIDKNLGTIRSGIIIMGISDPVIMVSYDVMTNEYQVTDSVKPEISQVITTDWKEALEYVKGIFETEKLKRLTEEIKLLFERGEI
jgi:hypothetical protein